MGKRRGSTKQGQRICAHASFVLRSSPSAPHLRRTSTWPSTHPHPHHRINTMPRKAAAAEGGAESESPRIKTLQTARTRRSRSGAASARSPPQTRRTRRRTAMQQRPMSCPLKRMKPSLLRRRRSPRARPRLDPSPRARPSPRPSPLARPLSSPRARPPSSPPRAQTPRSRRPRPTHRHPRAHLLQWARPSQRSPRRRPPPLMRPKPTHGAHTLNPPRPKLILRTPRLLPRYRYLLSHIYLYPPRAT
ncbi:hypothetical protein K438DRAFT_77985 [Mycena galopus ATCC 62051]|nr:hypothetical protein K438DRAFT_77985 [Mycena galopus ATCC 62051]